jgi:AAHS family 4-hydroxybenzoate transporter-like MFS transporter
MVTISACGYLFGSSTGGVLAAVLIPRYGWPSVFQVGGALPILMAIVAAVVLPDSIRHLVLQGKSRRQITHILRQIAPDLAFTPDSTFVVPETRPTGFPIIELFHEGRAQMTSLIWVTQFMYQVVAFFIFSWLPLLFSTAGLAAQRSMLAAAALPLGAMLGTLLWGRIIDKFSAPFTLGCAALMYALFLAPVGSVTRSFAMLVALLFLAGIGAGSQSAFNSFTASVYPTLIRSTGVGWAIGVGRVGSVLGPLFGGAMINRHWSLPSIFYAAALPVVIVATSLFLLIGSYRTAAARSAGRALRATTANSHETAVGIRLAPRNRPEEECDEIQD